MAERDTMEMQFFAKCTFISSRHVIFDVTIFKGEKVIGNVNIIVDDSLSCDIELSSTEKYRFEFFRESEEMIEKCKKRAKFIFNKN